MLRTAVKVDNAIQYDGAAHRFHQASEQNYQRAKDDNGRRYQQFFFHIRDDAGLPVEDFYIDFHVQGSNGRKHRKLTRSFDNDFEAHVTAHSRDRSNRVMLVDLDRLKSILREIRDEQAKLVMEISARKPFDEVSYDAGRFTIYDPAVAPDNQPSFIYPNTTTMVEVVLNRKASDRVLNLIKI